MYIKPLLLKIVLHEIKENLRLVKYKANLGPIKVSFKVAQESGEAYLRCFLRSISRQTCKS